MELIYTGNVVPKIFLNLKRTEQLVEHLKTDEEYANNKTLNKIAKAIEVARDEYAEHFQDACDHNAVIYSNMDIDIDMPLMEINTILKELGERSIDCYIWRKKLNPNNVERENRNNYVYRISIKMH